MPTDSFAVTLLRSSAEGFGGLAASRMFENGRALGAEDGGFAEWKVHLRQQVLALAAALEEGEPEEFTRRVAWSRDAFVARAVEVDSLRAGLEHLEATLQESLPPPAWEAVRPYLTRARAELNNEARADHAALDPSDECGRLALDYIAALRAGDAGRAVRLLVDSVPKLGAASLLESVVAPAMTEVGRLWHVGELSVAEEHFASMTSRSAIARVLEAAERPEPNGRSVIVTMVAGDAHDIGAHIVAALFEIDGWRAICLGADTPHTDLARLAEQFDADLVALGATLEVQRHAVASAIAAVREVRPDTPVVVGGSAFSGAEAAWQRIGANACAQSASAAVEVARGLLRA